MKVRTLSTVLLCIASAATGADQSDDLAAQAQTAKQAMAAGDFGRAAEIYGGMVREEPGNAGLMLNLGIALHYKGQYSEAAKELNAALRAQPDLTAANFFLGVSYAKLHQPKLAVAPLRAAAHAEPANKIFQFEFADALLATEQYGEAASGFKRVVDLDRDDAKGWQGLGLSYVGLSRLCFHALESASPDSKYVLLLLANSDLKQARYRSAYKLYREAVASGAAMPGIHGGLAEVYRKTEHPDWAAIEEARERAVPSPDCSVAAEECAFLAHEYDRVITSNSNGPEALYWKARSYEALALAAFDRLSQMPPTTQIHELMSEAYRVRGENHEAAEELREALKLEPQNERLQALYAAALWRDHDYAAAQPLLEKLVEGDSNSAELKFELGDTLLELDEPAKAQKLLARAVEMDPHLLSAHASLAKAYMELGRIPEAIPQFQAALPADTDGSLYFQLAKAYEKTGQSALAKRAREQFAALEKKRTAVRNSDSHTEIAAP